MAEFQPSRGLDLLLVASKTVPRWPSHGLKLGFAAAPFEIMAGIPGLNLTMCQVIPDGGINPPCAAAIYL